MREDDFNKEQLHREIMRAIELIEDGCPHMAKVLLESLANTIDFRVRYIKLV